MAANLTLTSSVAAQFLRASDAIYTPGGEVVTVRAAYASQQHGIVLVDVRDGNGRKFSLEYSLGEFADLAEVAA